MIWLRIKPFMPNVFSHHYQLDESSLEFWGGIFHFYSTFNRKFCKQTVENLIRRRVLRRLIWFCTVCRCPTKRTLCLCVLMKPRLAFFCLDITKFIPAVPSGRWSGHLISRRRLYSYAHSHFFFIKTNMLFMIIDYCIGQPMRFEYLSCLLPAKGQTSPRIHTDSSDWVGSSLAGGIFVLYPWARHFILRLFIVQHRERPDIADKMFTET